MEKFSKWRDASTGIQPFLPPKPPASDDAGRRALYVLKYYLLGPVFAVLRLALAAIVCVWLLLMSTVASVIPVPIVRWGFRRYTTALGARALLLLLGFWWIPTEWTTLRKGRGVASTPGMPGGKVQSGDLLVANWTSYVDILYLAFRFAPQFTQIVKVGSGTEAQYKVAEVSLLSALRSVFTSPSLASPAEGTKLYTLEEAQERAAQGYHGPLVVFPEATTSNNRTVLAFVPVFKRYTPKRAVHVVAFRHGNEDFSSTYTAGSPAAHVLSLACQPTNSLEVRYLPPDEVVAAPTAGSAPDGDDYGAQLGTLLCSVLRFRRARLGAEDKVAFLEFYNGSKAHNSKKTD